MPLTAPFWHDRPTLVTGATGLVNARRGVKGVIIRGLMPVFRYVDRFYQAHRDDEARGVAQFSMGRYSYGSPRLIKNTWDTARVRIGAFCSIAPEVSFMLGGNHRTECISTYPLRIKFALPNAADDGAGASKGDITVGNDVWIGHGAFILSGVTVGDGAVIGASAVVASDVRPYALVVGNPAREIRRRFNDAQVTALLEIAWWDWPLEKILAEAPYLSSVAVGDFIGRFRAATAA
jgi:acetyltransferase-like isoleucine patch superfamily enzyme